MAEGTTEQVDSDTVPDRRLDSRTRNLGDRFVVGGPRQAVELSGPGALIWRSIDGTRSVRQLAELIAADYDVDLDTATGDTAQLIAELCALRVVTLHRPRHPPADPAK